MSKCKETKENSISTKKSKIRLQLYLDKSELKVGNCVEYECWNTIFVGEFLRNAAIELGICPEYDNGRITNVEYVLLGEKSRNMAFENYNITLLDAGMKNNNKLVIQRTLKM
mmetsp:Transcript_2278/g.3267  ORF Transcript_2278/g.3267 Transcript_2278/m.3267 type:complete len:112 (-) Transcript_2278:95-430(-)